MAALRAPRVGIPLTWGQYYALGAPMLLQRLLARHEHSLAWRIADYLRLTSMQATIGLHWSQACIHEAPAALSDEALLAQLTSKLQMSSAAGRPRVAQVAAEAHRVGRQRLAMRLLEDHEPDASQQVPLLLTMNELSAALAKAVASSNVELVHLVILHARGTVRLCTSRAAAPSSCALSSSPVALMTCAQANNTCPMASAQVYGVCRRRTTPQVWCCSPDSSVCSCSGT